MTKRHGGMAVALGAVLAACGGGGSGGNAAAGKTFTYGTPVTASSAYTGAVQDQVTSALQLQGSPGASSASALAQSSLADELLGDSGVPLLQAEPRQRQALLRARSSLASALDSSGSGFGFQNPDCLQETPAPTAPDGRWRATLSNCKVVEQQGSESLDLTVNGSFEATASSLVWDLTAHAVVTGSDGSGTGDLHASGDLAATSTTLKGGTRNEISLRGTVNGQAVAIGLAESVDLDVNYDAQRRCIVDPSTVEAKRVWTARPSGASASDLPDKGAKITWSGCGTGTIAFSR